MILDGTGADIGYTIAFDPIGTMYLCGKYIATTTIQINNFALNNTPQSSGFTLPSTSATGALFVLRYSPTGTLLGSMVLNGTGVDSARGVATDSTGSVYVSGQYTSTTTVQINNLALSSAVVSSGFTLPAATSGAMCVLKYNSAGTLLGSMVLDGVGSDDMSLGITTDLGSNVYVAGYYFSTTTAQINNFALNNTPQTSGFTLPTAPSTGAFVLKYNLTGTLLGSMVLDGSSIDFGNSVTTDSAGNMYLAVFYGAATTTNINNLALSSTPVASGFTMPAASTFAGGVLKYNSVGTFLGSMILDGTVGADSVNSITTDYAGNIYMTGQYAGATTTVINNLALSSTSVNSGYTFPAASTPAAFVLKYDTTGKLLGSMILDATDTDVGNGITVDFAGNIYVTGQYTASATAQINNLDLSSTAVNSGYTLPSTNTTGAMFVLKYSFSDTTLINKSTYLQSPGNYYTINNGPSFLTVPLTSNIIKTDWTLDRWQLTIA